MSQIVQAVAFYQSWCSTYGELLTAQFRQCSNIEVYFVRTVIVLSAASTYCAVPAENHFYNRDCYSHYAS